MKNGKHAVLSFEAFKQFCMVNRVDIGLEKSDLQQQAMPELSDLSRGLGRTKRVSRIVLNEDIQPHVLSARRVRHAFRDTLKAELDRMVVDGIIEKVQQPTDGVSL